MCETSCHRSTCLEPPCCCFHFSLPCLEADVGMRICLQCMHKMWLSERRKVFPGVCLKWLEGMPTSIFHENWVDPAGVSFA